MKRIKLILSMLLAALLLPTSLLAQTEGETETITSTFTTLGSDIQRTEYYSTGSILTEEGNDWYFVSSATVLMNGSAGSFGLRLRGVRVGLQSYYDLTGLVKKVTVRAGGNLSEIGVMINDARQSVTVTSTDVQDYVFDFGDGVYVDYHKDAVGTNKTYISVDLTPKDDDYDNPTIVECVKVECVREKGESKEVGDANGDGEIDVADIDFVIEHIGEPIDDTNRASDVNGDGEINVADVDYIIERIK